MDSKVKDYDAIVLGSGQAGGPLAGALAGSGRRTALIEREHVGGGETLVKAVVDAETGRVPGVTILGIEGGQAMDVPQMAMTGNVPYTATRDGARPTPTGSLDSLLATVD
ncbi:MAG: hypothetical protein WKF95_09020 [Rubrobacter sp.]